MKDVLDLIHEGRNLEAMSTIVRSCFERRRSQSRRSWHEYATRKARDPRILSYVHRCSMTRRSFEKPRGYAGDAVMLDHIYGTGDGRLAPHPASVDGQIYAYTVNAAAPRAVRFRRATLARLIDETAERTGSGKAVVVSIAAGHLREADLARSIQSRSLGRLIAIDQDAESVAVVDREYGPLGVEARVGSLRQIIAGRLPLPRCDLIYAAGLYDYLDDKVGARLLQLMFDALNPGGRVLVANFVPNVPDVGYMEAFMDWWLTYRDMEQVIQLFDVIPAEQRGSLETFFDPDYNIAFAVAQKVGGR